MSIATRAAEKFDLKGVYIAHRLGVVPISEASIVVAVSAGHRGMAWKAGEEVLEEVKEKVEIWKREEFVDGGWSGGRIGRGMQRGDYYLRLRGENRDVDL
ncbi:molybdenum cofactor biosynthesis protein MoaE [Aspergillus novofumigatus IBT 16806]|uniref:Molybdopterin biosynthesis MoaE n=1 Tax=Aspergillus novofumigatus (strain IBT 16806) TaxID=1392255 RepID=A0A2I1C2A7_ASPN1|nr:Molybdopterin biosynthesis MoaE [Aspergillus novofumigatus IBT 16806]PKX91758.1 Molybdopterin biosynthesis MoaE [Aspergillus novofumigatus IBT 16806]